jgi:DNA-binding GntR family transcriptional regulator
MDKVQPRVPLREQIAQAIRRAILSGELRAGDRVPEQELAGRLGVSRLPVREAIRMLEQQGLLVARPNLGVAVAEPTHAEISDAAHVRAALEALAVEQALERSSAEEWAEHCATLALLLDEMRAAGERHDEPGGVEKDIEWHGLMIRAAKNRSLDRAWENLGMAIPLMVQASIATNRDLEARWADVVKDHQELLGALRRRDVEIARQAVRAHIFRRLGF